MRLPSHTTWEAQTGAAHGFTGGFIDSLDMHGSFATIASVEQPLSEEEPADESDLANDTDVVDATAAVLAAAPVLGNQLFLPVISNK